MKKHILFLLFLLSAHYAYAVAPKVEYKVNVYFFNYTSYDIDVIGITQTKPTHLAQAIRPEDEFTKMELPGTKDGLFITSMIVYGSSGEKQIYGPDNIVVRQINWDIADSVNCKKTNNGSVFSLKITDKIINALAEAEEIDNNGSISKALRKGLVERDGIKYKLKKSNYFFYDYDPKNKIKILQFINRMEQNITLTLNNDKELIIPKNKIGSIAVPDNFVLKSLGIDDMQVTNPAHIKQINDTIALIIPYHACAVDINYDLLSMPVIFQNDMDKGFTIVINKTITFMLASKAKKTFSRDMAARLDKRGSIRMVELPISNPGRFQYSIDSFTINGIDLDSEAIRDLNDIINHTPIEERPAHIVIDLKLLDKLRIRYDILRLN